MLLQTFLVFCDLDRGASGAASDLSQLSLTTVGLSVLWSHREARNHNSVERVCPPYTEPRILRHDPQRKERNRTVQGPKGHTLDPRSVKASGRSFSLLQVVGGCSSIPPLSLNYRHKSTSTSRDQKLWDPWTRATSYLKAPRWPPGTESIVLYKRNILLATKTSSGLLQKKKKKTTG